jgi:hypothetical protein
MKKFLTDIPVALIFFNRPDTFAKVFESVAAARPSKLFLIQDGARKNKCGEEKKVLECRNLINVDWECEVYEDFATENLGCGRRVFTGISKAFEVVDRLVIIEDDIVIGEDMLPFCFEMLERYKNDERIGLISGMNHIGIYDRIDKSYFFSYRGGAIWGWATWKRVWDSVDWNLQCARNQYLMDTLSSMTLPQIDGKQMAQRAIEKYESMQKGERQTSWTTQFVVTACVLQSRLYIVPSKNLTSNIGIMGEHSNSSSITTVPRGQRRIYFARVYKLEWPLKHPEYVIDDAIYSGMQRKIMNGGFLGKYLRVIERLLYRVFPILGK